MSSRSEFGEYAMSLSALLEESFEIAWNYLQATGEIGNRDVASRFLADRIEFMIKSGQRSRLVLSNKAIDAYKRSTSRQKLSMVS